MGFPTSRLREKDILYKTFVEQLLVVGMEQSESSDVVPVFLTF